MIPPSSLVFPLLEGHPCWSTCGRRTRPFSGRAFREHRTNVGVLPLFHRAGCSSTENYLIYLLTLLPHSHRLSQEGGLFGLPLRASNEHIPIVRVPQAGGRPYPPCYLSLLRPKGRVACLGSYCARPTRAFSGRALREQGSPTGSPPLPFSL